MITPIVNEPALLSTGSKKVLSVADIHLGIEWELRMGGIRIPSQADAHKKRLTALIRRERPDAVVLLGDVKHNVPYTSRQEWREVPELLRELGALAEVHIVPGNHDGDLERIIGGVQNVSMHPMGGFVLDGVGYVHGHAWPSVELFSAGCIVMSHNHPAIRFTDRLGHRSTERVWIRTHFCRDALESHYGGLDWHEPEVIVMPAFNSLCGGVAFNEALPQELLGPVFSANAVDLEHARVYLLDGTDLGMLGGIRWLEVTRRR